MKKNKIVYIVMYLGESISPVGISGVFKTRQGAIDYINYQGENQEYGFEIKEGEVED